MPLYIAFLRLWMLFLNVYDSFKTLKIPPPSARNNGRPSVRAMTQRKRDMKGCLAVWIVWCCLTAYERLLESVVCIFIPFYSEFKALFMLFLILTRARGAEPIFLHVIRPVLKPYASTLDSVLLVAHSLGDLVLLLAMYPLRRLGFFGRSSEPDMNTPPPPNHKAYSDTTVPRYPAGLGPGQPTQRSVSAQQLRTERSYDQISRQVSAEQQRHSAFEVERSRSSSTNSAHQIWHPPPSSYNDDTDQIEGLPANSSLLITEDLEWRQYPPFPSAYPPTPIMPTSKTRLDASPNGMASQFSLGSIQYVPIPEEQHQEDEQRQGFHLSLSPAREPPNPGSVSSLSDENDNNLGVQNQISQNGSGYDSSNDSMLVDPDGPTSTSDHEVDEEDDFDVTLQTPISRAPSFYGTTETSSTPDIDSPMSPTFLQPPADSPPPILGQKRSFPKGFEDDADAPSDADSDAPPDPLKDLSPNTSLPKRFISQRQSKAGVVNPRPLRQPKPPKKATASSSSSSSTRSSETIDTSSADEGRHITKRNPPESKRRRIVPPVPTTRVTRASTRKIDSSKGRRDEPMLIKDDDEEEEGSNI